MFSEGRAFSPAILCRQRNRLQPLKLQGLKPHDGGRLSAELPFRCQGKKPGLPNPFAMFATLRGLPIGPEPRTLEMTENRGASEAGGAHVGF
jgi:hypothetical protein